MELLNSPQLRIFDQTYTLLSDKDKFKQQLSSGINVKIQRQQEQNCLQNSFLCCGCLPSESTRLKKQQQINQKQAIPAMLSARVQNETLFELKFSDGKTHIGSWYDLFVFEEWQDYFYSKEPVISQKDMQTSFQPSSDLFNKQQNWYSKIILWFSNFQFKLIVTNRQDHQRLFKLFMTMKTYYTKLHPQSQYNSIALRHFVHYNIDRDPFLSRDEIDKLMDDLNFERNEFTQCLQQIPEFKQTGKLSQEGFMKLIEVLQCPPDLYVIFQRYAKSSVSKGTIYEKYSQKCMSQSQFNLFLKEIQHQPPQSKASEISFIYPAICSSFLQKNSVFTPSSPKQSSISFIEFCHYVLSNSKNPAIQPEDINCSKPLAHYFVNSSHNTYLVGNQLTSMSSANVYYLNLIEGMRCVELDIHDSPEGPIIKHGFTFTAKIFFDQAMKAIMKFCIEHPNHTPVILSFENHCNEQNRIKMAQTLSLIPLQKFYLIPQKGTNQQEFPTLQELKGKIIIQGTGIFQEMFPKIRKNQTNFQLKNKSKLNLFDITHEENHSSSFSSNKKKQFLQKVSQLEKQKSRAETRFLQIQKKFSVLTQTSNRILNKYYGMVAAPFSLTNSCWQMANIAENNLLKMVKGQMTPTPQEIYHYSWKSLIRIYPFGLRFGSSNYNPIPMLQLGCQLVSLNTQNVDVYYVCVQGMFEKNKQCGYIRKPDVKQQNTKNFSYKIVFMDCIDIKPRIQINSDAISHLQVSFIGSQKDMKTNFKYVNNLKNPNSVDTNEPVTISEGFKSKNVQAELIGVNQFRFQTMKSVLEGISPTPYPCVQLQVSHVDYAHLYINLRHCGSMSVPLVDLRQGLRMVPIYRFDIGRKKTKGHLLIWTEIQNLN